MEHTLKTWPEYFERVLTGQKTFEVRFNDRDFQTGDLLTLEEYILNEDAYTGRRLSVIVSYVLIGNQFGIAQNYCVMGIVNPQLIQ